MEWVFEKQPEKSEYYLVIIKEYYGPTVEYFSKGYGWNCNHKEIVCWHELPEPPTKKEME